MSPRADFPASEALYESHLFGEAVLACVEAGIPLPDALYSIADAGPDNFVMGYHAGRVLARDYREIE